MILNGLILQVPWDSKTSPQDRLPGAHIGQKKWSAGELMMWIERDKLRKPVLVLSAILACLILHTPIAKASWLIDTDRFHISVHGRTSCIDCHNDITQLVSHPRPADVSKELQDFFGPEKCTACHEEALDDISCKRI